MNETADDASRQTDRTTERMFIRLTFWQTVLSLVGVFIAVVALYAALNESAAVRQQTAAAVWPFVQFAIEEGETEDSAHFSIQFTNTGVGPARMRSMKVRLNGESVRDWNAAIALLGGADSEGSEGIEGISRNFITNRVLAPGESVKAFETTNPDLRRRFLDAATNDASYVAYCYCSIFDECWLADSRGRLLDPEPTAACPDFGEAAFTN